MKIIKLLVVTAFLFIGTIYSTTAQSILSKEQQEKIVVNVNNFIYDLNLSERDKPAFRVIIEDLFIGLLALRATDFPVDTDKKIMKTLLKSMDGRVKDLLSTDQYKVYKARVKERQANIKEFMKEV